MFVAMNWNWNWKFESENDGILLVKIELVRIFGVGCSELQCGC